MNNMKKDSVSQKYKTLMDLKWEPKSGEIKHRSFEKGEKITVLHRGIFITDKQGGLLIRNPEDTQVFSNLINHVWELWAKPELKRRQEANLAVPYPLKGLYVLFEAGKDKSPTVKFNDEYHLIANIRLKRTTRLDKDQVISFDQFADFGTVNPPTKDGKPIGFLMVRFKGSQISLYFDFRPTNPKFNRKEWKDESRWLADACLETLLADQFGHLSLLIPELSKKDIPFTIGLKAEKMTKICKIIQENMEGDEINKKISRLVTRKDVKEFVKSWSLSPIFNERTSILTEIEKSYINGTYGAVIVLLMSQVEGIITEELISKKLGTNKNGKAKPWKTRIDEFYNVTNIEEIGPMALRILDGVYYFLNNSSLYRKFSWDSKSDDCVNRHAALHGKDTTFNTRANAIRMILLFDALYWILLAISFNKEKHD